MDTVLHFGNRIDAYAEDMIRDLAALVAIPSVCGPAEGEFPYGKASAQALDFVLNRAAEMGLSVYNADHYAGHAEYGEGDEIAAVLAHVDVVPVGPGWDTDPFTLTQKGDLLYGRGTADDKGAAIAALYALKALKDAGVTGKRRLRVIFGSGEEIGMEDLPHYFESQPLPDVAFTPDSDYGVCNREKGILRVRVQGAPSPNILRFTGGTVVNAVPDQGEILLHCSLEEAKALSESSLPGEFSFSVTSEGIEILSKGKAVHAMQPDEGFNAVSHGIALLGSVLAPEDLGGFLTFLHTYVGCETNGASLGIACSDEPSGALTCNLGLLHMDASGASAEFDIRYPVTAEGEKIIEAFRACVEKAGLQFTVTEHTLPLYLPADSPFIHLLQGSYTAVTGQPCNLYATGGGTYARAVSGRGVAFGPIFPDEPDRGLHQVNEHIDRNRYLEHARICLEAMYRMLQG